MPCVAAERRGIALFLVLWTLVIGAALLTVAVFLILQEQRAGQAGRRLVHTFTRAEASLAEALGGWTPGSLNRALPGVRDSLGTMGSDVAIQRLNQGLFLLTVRVRDGATEARLGRLVRVRPVHLAATAALASGGQVQLVDAATIRGEDQPPTGSEDCPAPDSAVAGVAAPSVTESASSVITGSPPSIARPPADSGLASEDLLVFHELASQATLNLAGGTWQTRPATVGTVCNPSSPENWGDPDFPGRPCGAYRPIIYVAGDLDLPPGRGQGILLVEGHLTLHGPYDFAGLIMVRGGLDVASGDSAVRLNGAVFAGSVGAQTTPPAVLSITYSKCLLSNALLSSGQLVPLRSRSWKALF